MLRPGDVHLYTVCDYGTEWLVYVMVIFTPWAFGTTQPWSVWTMNGAGYGLGALLAIKLFIRGVKGYMPPRWGKDSFPELPKPHFTKFLRAAYLKFTLVGLTLGVLLFCLVSALNAAATHDPDELNFIYHAYISWLPHSFDSSRTWLVFWNYLALSCVFWAIIDWLPGKSGGEERAARQKSLGGSSGGAPSFPSRLRRLLWVLCINGAMVGFTCGRKQGQRCTRPSSSQLPRRL